MLTANQILMLSEPVEQMYAECTSQLLINISRHFQTGHDLEMRDWEIRKLSEIGQLRQESIKIISYTTGKSEAEITEAIETATGKTLEEVEKSLSAAAKAGMIRTATGDYMASESVRNVIRNYVAQAVKDTNLVNTVMLESTLGRYRAAIADVTRLEELERIQQLTKAQNAPDIEKQLDKVQTILNQETGETNLGILSRRKALQKAVERMTKDGITGFIDAGGHEWTPEAYVNMDIRTTVHNTMLESQKARSADYGVNTFQISVVAAARPGCAPYQGKIYSWIRGDRGTIEDASGKRWDYQSIYDTTYGEPAGIFGINCHHSPQTFVPGYSFPRYEPLTKAEEKTNSAQYALSQEQRAMERDVRNLKTKELALKSAGLDGSEPARKAAEKTKEYIAFCKANGRTPRTDRMKVFGVR